MSGSTPSWRPRATRLLLLTVVFLALLQFLAWLALGPGRAPRTAARQKPEAGARSEPAQPQSIKPPIAARTSIQPAAARQISQKVLRYGNAEGEIGMIHEREQEPVGPEAFALGKDDEILVADVANQRVVIYSRDGTYLRSISLPGIALGDVMAEKQGRVCVYDQVRRSLHLYDADGTPRSTVSLDPRDIDTRGYFHTAGNAIYFADAAARDVLVATIQDGKLVAPDKSAERTTEGIHAESGRIYSVSLDKGQAVRLQVQDPTAGAGARPLEAPLPGIVSARFAGEDRAQRFYVQTERLDGSRIVLEVLTFSPGGELLTTTRMPENDYAIWTARLVDVRSDGTLVQFLPQRDQARLNLFAN